MYAPNFYGGNGIVGAQVRVQLLHITVATMQHNCIFYRYLLELGLDLHSSITNLTGSVSLSTEMEQPIRGRSVTMVTNTLHLTDHSLSSLRRCLRRSIWLPCGIFLACLCVRTITMVWVPLTGEPLLLWTTTLEGTTSQEYG